MATLFVSQNGRVTANEIELNQGGILSLTSGVTTEIDAGQIDINEGGLLIGNGDVQFGVLRNDGIISAFAGVGNQLRFLSGDLDLDGIDGAGQVLAESGNLRFSANLTDAFDGEMRIAADRQVEFFGSWELGQDFGDGGRIEFQGDIGAPAKLMTPIGAATFRRGEIDVVGEAEMEGRVRFESMMTTTVQANSRLQLQDTARFRGGTYQGPGMIQWQSAAHVEEPTTMNVGVVDLDGTDSLTVVNIDETSLTLNVDRIEELNNNRFDGTLNLNGAHSELIVNLNDPHGNWEMHGELSTVGAPLNHHAIGGSPFLMTGTMNMTGSTTISAPMDLSGTMIIGGVLSFVRLSDGPHTIRDTAGVTGIGRLILEESGSLFAEDGTVIGTDFTNNGRFEPGLSIGQVTFNEQFDQNATGTLAMEIAGGAGGESLSTRHWNRSDPSR